MKSLSDPRSIAHSPYLTSTGQIAPRVTTILDELGGEKVRGLMHWAWERGRAGEDYKKVRDIAADVGTIAHKMIECTLTGRPFSESGYAPDDLEHARVASSQFDEWWQKQGLELVLSEQRVVNEKHCYGGTVDLVAKDKSDKLWLIDFKTSKAVYAEYYFQVAAYKEALAEMNVLVKRVLILQLDKSNGALHVHHISKKQLAIGWRVFKHALAIYHERRKLEGKD